MAVTADEYELPLLVESNIEIFSCKIGQKKTSVQCELSLLRSGKIKCSGRNRGFLIREVTVEDD